MLAKLLQQKKFAPYTKFMDILASPTKMNTLEFQRISTYVLACMSLLFLTVNIILNIYIQTYVIIPLLLGAASSITFATLLAYFMKDKIALSQIIIILSLCFLGICLLIYEPNDPNYAVTSSVLWLALLPPMMMFTMGFRNGTIVFGVYYSALILLILTPLNVHLNRNITEIFSIHILLTSLGAFIFSWLAEFIRAKMQSALSQAFARSEKKALTDTLTGLGNRRYFDTILPVFISGAKRRNTHFSLAIIDLDHFKQVNDIYGHGVGDHILQHIANILEQKKRTSDFLFRWGGEEFIILAPDIKEDQAIKLANRLCAYVSNHPYVNGDLTISYTISIGLYVGDGGDDKLIPLQIADKNLYEAKNTGRDRVVA